MVWHDPGMIYKAAEEVTWIFGTDGRAGIEVTLRGPRGPKKLYSAQTKSMKLFTYQILVFLPRVYLSVVKSQSSINFDFNNLAKHQSICFGVWPKYDTHIIWNRFKLIST